MRMRAHDQVVPVRIFKTNDRINTPCKGSLKSLASAPGPIFKVRPFIVSHSDLLPKPMRPGRVAIITTIVTNTGVLSS